MNLRPRHVVLGFGLALLCALGGVGWLSVAALKMDRAEVRAKQRAELEENVRLALWRMDSVVAPLIASESARPYFTYRAFYPINRAYGNVFGPPGALDQLVPSPLLKEIPKYIQLHFQFVRSASLQSPQVPEFEHARRSHGIVESELGRRTQRLQTLRSMIQRRALYAALKLKTPGNLYAQRQNQAAPEQQQQRKSSLEWSARSKAFNTALSNSNMIAVQSVQSYNPVEAPPQKKNSTETDGGMSALWLADALLLARSVKVGGQRHVQGCWLDWDALQRALLQEVQDLLPNAKLEPLKNAAEARHTLSSRALVSLPVRLIPAHIDAPIRASASVKVTLAIAWAAVLLSALALGLLLLFATSLSERRAIFVSAVTHELRTPLTTFRMYTDMLSEGMIKDENKKREYIEILRREGVRLGHLVENVLSYARLERGRAQEKKERIDTQALLDRLVDRLEDRAMGADMELVVEVKQRAAVEVDVSVAEQVLFNLVDNACKYAQSAELKEIHLTLETTPKNACIRVSDHGPGVPADEQRQLFSPFSKSAQRAANSAPGVGLGLALSRRLARAMGGDLRYDPQASVGASFVFCLPRLDE